MSLIFSPIELPRLSLATRLYVPPMATRGADASGRVTPRAIEHYRAMAADGLMGLVIVEHAFVSPEGRAHNNQLSVADNACISGFAQLADTIHTAGSKAVAQISHAGAKAKPVNPADATAGPASLDAWEIARITEAFAAAAARMRQAGFDGVEIHAAHGYLLNQFFSPLANTRTDAYGGDTADRIRLVSEITQAVRAEVGDDLAVLVRLGADDGEADGTSLEDVVLASRILVQAGADAIDITGGVNGYLLSDRKDRQGYFADIAHAVRTQIGVPVLMAGGVTDAAAAEALAQAGDVDLVGVGRAMMRDAAWAQRAHDTLDK